VFVSDHGSTPGSVAGCTGSRECVEPDRGIKKKLGDSDSFGKSLRQDGITPVIPARANRKERIRHDKESLQGRRRRHIWLVNWVERSVRPQQA
jgi:hypothetical protein